MTNVSSAGGIKSRPLALNVPRLPECTASYSTMLSRNGQTVPVGPDADENSLKDRMLRDLDKVILARTAVT